jgi:hypothetical protein
VTAVTTAFAHWHQLKLSGTQVEMAADVTQNEALEGIITTACDVEIETNVTLVKGVAADLMYVEQISALMAPQFSGIVNHISGQSFPNRVVLTCVGPLAHLRRCPTVDHDLTGMTEGAAAKHILTACNVVYDASDIADSGYVLGAQTPVLWLKDQPGHEMLAELDKVFGMATIEVGAGRVVRFPYDRVPDAGAIVKTFTRGADVDFWSNQRDRGDLDAIVNLVQVRGATWQDAGNKCSYTPWGRGSANNDELGGTARNRSMAFQSDLIQDEALAQAVATRLMRWWNRSPDEITLVAQNDPTINCGAVIGVKDQAYGVDLTGAASTAPYLILTIDRRGDEMTLNCVGGAAGATGSITHGVEKVCNKTSSNFPIPGSFTPPAIGYPPLGALDWLPYAPGTDGKPGDGDHTSGGGSAGPNCVTPDAANWHEVAGTIAYGAGELDFSDMSGHPNVEFIFDPGGVSGSGTPIPNTTKVTIEGHCAPGGPGTGADAPLVSIELDDEGGNFAAFQAEWHPDSSTGYFYLYGFGGAFHQTDVSLTDITDGFDFALSFDPNANTLSMSINSGAWTASVALGSYTNATLTVQGTSATALATDFTSLHVCLTGAASVDLGGSCWTVWSAPVNASGASVDVTYPGYAFDTCAPIASGGDAPVAFTLTGVVRVGSGTSSVHFGVTSLDSGGNPNDDYEVQLFGPGWPDRAVHMQVGANYDFDTWGSGGFSAAADIAVTLTWNPATSTLSVLATQPGHADVSGSVTATAGQTSPGDLHVTFSAGSGSGSLSGVEVS